ncbi:hypothetical protein [uncultured Campylobacter sp.]|uniref:hypothetical protein n=1 Tax=uncultured Campylobacter sp. TaxID=218934 RepID=UPI00260D62E0|nr:hypothetical protein [uncultured Campylobacter sp.]
MNAMKFTEIYAASVCDTMRQAWRHPASREALTADLSRKILSALVSRRNFERLNFKSTFESSETGLRDAASS